MSNRIKLTLALVVFGTFGPLATTSAQDPLAGDFGHIRYLLLNSTGVYLYTDDTSRPMPHDATCIKNRFILRPSHPRYRDLYALLLTAYGSGGRVKVWIDRDDCADSSPVVHSLQIEAP